MIDLITDLKVVFSTPVLEMANSRGLTKYWQGFVVADGEEFFLKTHAWQQTAGGLSKVNESPLNRVAGKNLGRANETTPEHQAIFEITSKASKKRDEGYHEKGEVYTGYPLPMLAHKFIERGHDIKFPCYVQPKLDGQRCVSNGSEFWTRKGKLVDPKVVEHLQFDSGGRLLDGELILPTPFCFDDTERAIKKFRSPEHPEKGKSCNCLFSSNMLRFHVFDIVDEDRAFIDRHREVTNILLGGSIPDQIVLVSTTKVYTEDEVMSSLHDCISQGYEGLILRNIDGFYTIGKRSKDLQKLKEFHDSEFTVVDVVDGRGREEGAAIYVCVTNEGREFTCRPLGTIEERKAIFQDKASYIGRALTVKYQELTTDGIPRFLSGVGFKSDR